RILGPASFLCPIRPAPRTSRLPSPTLFRSAEVVQELPDARHVALVHRVADEGVGRVEHGGIVAARRLQRAQPGVYVFGRKFGFRSEEHTSEVQSRENLVCRLLLERSKLAMA